MGRTSDADFNALYERTYGHVWRTLGRAGVLRTAERCELMQDVYLVAHQKRATRNPAASELAWMSTIAWNVARRHRDLMRTRKEQPVDEPDLAEDTASDSASTEDIVAQRRRYLLLMQGLAFERRAVFEMHEVDGFTLEEVAGALGIPVGTAKTRLRAAHADLEAAASRMDARDAPAEGRAGALPLLLPFGVGAWRPAAALFDDAPAGMRERVRREVCRAIDRAAVVSAVSGAAGGKAAGVLLGSGFALGGATVGGVLYLLHLLAAPPSAQSPIVRAPGAIPVAVAPAEVSTASVASSSTSAAPAAIATVAPLPPQAAPGGIDPEEERLLERAQAAYARGNREAAREALDEHARRFPPWRAKLGAESERLRAKLDAGGTSPTAPADAGRNPHRLLGSDE